MAYAVASADLPHNRTVSEIRIGDRGITEGSAPARSPDGATIAFLRQGQIWKFRADGSKAEKITSHASTIDRFLWSPDGKLLAFLSQDPVPKTDPTIFGVNDIPRVRLWVYDYFRAARTDPSVPVFPGRCERIGEATASARILHVHCGGYGAMPSGLVFRGNTGTGRCEKIAEATASGRILLFVFALRAGAL